MAIPTKALIWTSLNFLRLLSIIAALLVFVSNITSMVADGRGVHAANLDGALNDDGIACDYIPGTDVPSHVWGLFWAHLNRTFELFLLIFCIVSELNWGGMAERLFSYTLPILSRSFGTAPLGLLQMILACSNLSHDLGKFPLVTNWILFVIGILNLLAGAIFKAAGKNLRSFHAGRRAAVSSPIPGGRDGGEQGRAKVVLPFAHQRASAEPTTPTKGGGGGGLMRQLRYVKDSSPVNAPITSTRTLTNSPQAPQRNLTPAGGAAVIGRPSQAFDSNIRYKRTSVASEGGPASTAPLAASEVYLYDSDTDRIRVPQQARLGTDAPTASAGVHQPSSSAGLRLPTAARKQEPTPPSGAYALARAVVARADEMARARIGSNNKNQPPSYTSAAPASASALAGPSSSSRQQPTTRPSKSAEAGLAGTETATQYHVRYGERGEGYGGHWRGHLRQRSSASVTGSLNQSPFRPGLGPISSSGRGAGHPAAVGGGGAATPVSHVRVSSISFAPVSGGGQRHGTEHGVGLMASPGRPF
ncbi:unnamed protein product [Tilletia controversa]|uniref:Uncharacterized protein n=3 Tax=Tilletia TaxID=13289 RepID=A0A8X7MY39_9BASI|nr:hypothetical protein CF336_g79 [Tilletia laevis]KAE8203482.1 hypothetical protein CF328_g1629 [Tilletia controversa]KAE8265792.1 hypothetical protein A4X03_0g44 [Tilletia caries]KAE8208937.1 hypothetical protein CF335_g34 [Tilletia laevis]KAE8252460.1 hypothetical protein A4X06_0g2176 [Tilletia controversa]